MLRRVLKTNDDSVAQALGNTPDLLALHRNAPERYPFLLQSTATESSLGRFDILFACPGDTLVLEEVGSVDTAGDRLEFLNALDDQWRSVSTGKSADVLPFTGGWFLYLGYELSAEIEPALIPEVDPVLPAAFAVRCKAAIISDKLKRQSYLVYEPDLDLDPGELLSDVAECVPVTAPMNEVTTPALAVSEDIPADFVAAVIKAKEHIAAGNVYQANLSRCWTASAEEILDASRIYAALSRTNPAPFAGIARWKEATIISSSPERLLRIRDGIVSTRPIAGTRPRSENRDIDDSLSAELFSNAKEVAEHVMLIDLERNDLGRVCEPGSVQVDEMMVLESYSHVHHIVSNVRGELRSGVTPGDAIRAVFPGGTITGCPKVRCMEIIHDLEKEPRGAYTGSFGYLNRDGSLDLNILIRTMVVHGNKITFRAGSGIVADSEPDAELAETRAKAEGLLRALAK